MKIIPSFEGIKIELKQPDLDGDRKTGGIEVINRNFDDAITEVTQPTEMGEMVKEINNDNIERESRMSGIDMKSRLHPMEVPALLGLDSLVALRFLPKEIINFSRQKKRLSVSLNGLGRSEIVSLVQGKQDIEQNKTGFFGRMINNFKGGKDENSF